MSIRKITKTEAATLGVSSLPNRPSAPTLYNGEAMTASELRAAFDRLPLLVAERLNALIDSAGLYAEEETKDTLASLIATGIMEGHSLSDLFAEIKSGDLARYLSVDGERALSEALAEIEGILALPDGFADLRSYVDAPAGEVEKDDPLPVSGDKVFHHAEELEERLSARILPVTDQVTSGETQPVSSDGVFKELSRVASPLNARLTAIESAMEGMPFYFDTVTADGASATVPDGVMRYARLDGLTGNTVKSKNILRLFPSTVLGSVNNAGTTTVYSVDENGYFCIDSGGMDNGVSSFIYPAHLFTTTPATVTISAQYIEGTAVGPVENVDAALCINNHHFYLPTAENPYVSFTVSNVSYPTQTELYAVGSFSHYKIALQIEEGGAATPFLCGLRSAKVKEVRSYGKNLYSGPSDIELKGTYDVRVLCRPEAEGATTFSFKREGTHANLGGIFKIFYTDGSELVVGPTMLSTTHEKKIKAIQLVNWALCEGRVYDIQLEYGSAATSYAPYTGLLGAYSLPKEAQAMDGYGVQVGDARNRLDLGEKRLKGKVKEILLTGKEDFFTYEYSGMNGVSTPALDASYMRTKGLCSDANVPSIASTSIGNMWLGVNNSNVYWLGIMDLLGLSPTNLSAFKAYLAARYESGNPVRILYVAANEESVDVSHLLPTTPYFAVEEGGHIETISEEGLPATLTVTYQIKTES